MSKASAKAKWGEWISERGRVIGFRRQKDLADAIGCTENQLSRWIQRATPPQQMRKGFDEKLAVALQLPYNVVFREWVNYSPESEHLPVMAETSFSSVLDLILTKMSIAGFVDTSMSLNELREREEKLSARMNPIDRDAVGRYVVIEIDNMRRRGAVPKFGQTPAIGSE